MLKLNPTYFRNILEEFELSTVDYKKENDRNEKSIFGVSVELTDAVEKFEL